MRPTVHWAILQLWRTAKDLRPSLHLTALLLSREPLRKVDS